MQPLLNLTSVTMITVKKLKEYLDRLPDDAKIHAYEGESTGLAINSCDGRCWWIDAYESDKEDTYTEGFGMKKRVAEKIFIGCWKDKKLFSEDKDSEIAFDERGIKYFKYSRTHVEHQLDSDGKMVKKRLTTAGWVLANCVKPVENSSI